MTTVMDAAYSRQFHAPGPIMPVTDYTDILHRFAPIIFFNSREAVLDAKNSLERESISRESLSPSDSLSRERERLSLERE